MSEHTCGDPNADCDADCMERAHHSELRTSKELTGSDLSRATQLTPEEEADLAFKLGIAHRCAQNSGSPESRTVYGDALAHIERLKLAIDSRNRRIDVLIRQPTHEPRTEQQALAEFTDYFVRNYPGPDTIIYDPRWHAPKIFRAAAAAITGKASGWFQQCNVCGHEPVPGTGRCESHTATKRSGRCPHGYELANLDDGTDTCAVCPGLGE